MSSWDSGSLGPPTLEVQVELYTVGFRVSGTMSTRFRKATDILNLSGSDHLAVGQATVTEYADPTAARGGQQVRVAISEILFGISSGAPEDDNEFQVQKRPVKMQVGMAPFWLTGMFHVPEASQAMEGLMNVSDRFVPLTDVAVSCAPYPAVDGTADVVAVHRALAQVFLVADDRENDNLLADILPEEEVRGWIPAPMEDNP